MSFQTWSKFHYTITFKFWLILPINLEWYKICMSEDTRLTVPVYRPQWSLLEGQTHLTTLSNSQVALSVMLQETQRKWMITANSLVKVCKRVFELPLFPVGRRMTAVRSGGIKNWCCMQGKATGLLGTGERFLMKYWKRLEMGQEHVCPSSSALPPANNVRALKGNSQSYQLRCVGSCECVSKSEPIHALLSIYLKRFCLWMWTKLLDLDFTPLKKQ